MTNQNDEEIQKLIHDFIFSLEECNQFESKVHLMYDISDAKFIIIPIFDNR